MGVVCMIDLSLPGCDLVSVNRRLLRAEDSKPWQHCYAQGMFLKIFSNFFVSTANVARVAKRVNIWETWSRHQCCRHNVSSFCRPLTPFQTLDFMTTILSPCPDRHLANTSLTYHRHSTHPIPTAVSAEHRPIVSTDCRPMVGRQSTEGRQCGDRQSVAGAYNEHDPAR